MNNTVIEIRINGKLTYLTFDGTKEEIEKSINSHLADGATDLYVVENPNNFKFNFNN